MSDAQHVLTTEECFVCGDLFEVYTRASQDGDAEWYAGDGDDARCGSCGAVGWVSCDAETPAWINYDEDDPTNVAAYDAEMFRWETRKGRAMDTDTQRAIDSKHAPLGEALWTDGVADAIRLMDGRVDDLLTMLRGYAGGDPLRPHAAVAMLVVLEREVARAINRRRALLQLELAGTKKEPNDGPD